jgi:hypothetical protein
MHYSGRRISLISVWADRKTSVVVRKDHQLKLKRVSEEDRKADIISFVGSSGLLVLIWLKLAQIRPLSLFLCEWSLCLYEYMLLLDLEMFKAERLLPQKMPF